MTATTKLTTALKTEATRLGFQWTGACPAVEPRGISRLHDWLDSGFAGQMHYFGDRTEAYQHPQYVLDGVQSVLMLGMNYHTYLPVHNSTLPPGGSDAVAAGEGEETNGHQCPKAEHGRVSRYAWGSADYHDLIHSRLKQLARFAADLAPDARFRGIVDTAPFLEREFAQLAGLGWIGKNTMLINKHAGSWFFLAALLTDLPLAYDQPHETNHCGTCRACLDACPTDAFVEPYVLDARRCISYLTIEHRGEIDEGLRDDLAPWVFGCDICQEVCPWNRRAPTSDEPAFQPLDALNPVDLPKLFDMNDDQFRAVFRKTPLWRPRRRGLLRNAALVLAHHATPESIAALELGLNDAESTVRDACAWSLKKIADTNAER